MISWDGTFLNSAVAMDRWTRCSLPHWCPKRSKSKFRLEKVVWQSEVHNKYTCSNWRVAWKVRRWHNMSTSRGGLVPKTGLLSTGFPKIKKLQWTAALPIRCSTFLQVFAGWVGATSSLAELRQILILDLLLNWCPKTTDNGHGRHGPTQLWWQLSCVFFILPGFGSHQSHLQQASKWVRVSSLGLGYGGADDCSVALLGGTSWCLHARGEGSLLCWASGLSWAVLFVWTFLMVGWWALLVTVPHFLLIQDFVVGLNENLGWASRVIPWKAGFCS